MKVKAINLKIGDKLTASGTTIVKAPILANPAGIRSLGYNKVTDVILTVRYASGVESVRVWNKNTEIKIERP